MDNWRMYIMWLMVIGMSVISLVDAQVLPPCGKSLLPCIEYAISTNHSIPEIHPPDICCNPIKDVFDATQETCFCQLAFTPGLFEAFGVKFAQAYRILRTCGVKFDTTFCNASSPTLPLSSLQPAATPIGDEGGAGRINALTEVCFILFILAFLLFY